MQIAKQGMFCIDLKNSLFSHRFGSEHLGFFQAVQFQPNGVGTLPKLFLQIAQIGCGSGVQEELQQHFNPRFGRDEGLNHGALLSNFFTQ
jgi:hypothetical protein